mmetsp:Transcript_3905/g.7769  ORF Transcript_3905/g.7769 Transcript_3905/m.7769 type:complete len:215 (-) Transcript_3905:32-676(-)
MTLLQTSSMSSVLSGGKGRFMASSSTIVFPSTLTTKFPFPGFSLLISTTAASPTSLAILLARVLKAPHCLQASTLTVFLSPLAAGLASSSGSAASASFLPFLGLVSFLGLASFGLASFLAGFALAAFPFFSAAGSSFISSSLGSSSFFSSSTSGLGSSASAAFFSFFLGGAFLAGGAAFFTGSSLALAARRAEARAILQIKESVDDRIQVCFCG